MTTPDELRAEAIRRIATALDLPAELLTTEPASDMLDHLTKTTLRPELEAAGIPNPEDYHLTWETPHADTP